MERSRKSQSGVSRFVQRFAAAAPRHLRTLVSTFAAAVLVALAGTQPAQAQVTNTGTITGSVADTSGAVVPGATITVEGALTHVTQRTVSSGAGVFVIPNLQPGFYTVEASKNGFTTAIISNVQVHSTQTATLAFKLNVGNVSTRVVVSAGHTQIQLTTPSVTHALSSRQVSQLPMNGRNYQTLAALMPGTVNTSPGNQMGQGGFNTNSVLSVNGMGTAGTFYTVDGIWNENTGNFTQPSVTPPPDTIQEVRLLQNNYSAQDSLMGASVMVVQTKSGTSQFHGSAYDFLRNDAVDARNYFSSTVTPLKQNIYGYMISGPFFIPHVYNTHRDKSFFIWSQQWSPQNIASVTRGLTATAAERSGDFSALLPGTQLINPATGQPIPGNQIQNLIVPEALALMNAAAPLPNAPLSGGLNYTNLLPSINRQRNDFAKVNQIINQKWSVMAELVGEHATTLAPNNPFTPSPFSTTREKITWPDYLAQVQVSTVVTPNMFNMASVAMNHRVVSLTQEGISELSQVPDYSQSVPFTGGFQQQRLPTISFSEGYSSFGSSAALPLINNSNLDLTLFDNWSWSRGKHYLQVGAAWYNGLKRQTNSQSVSGSSNGDWSFTGVATGNPIADYLMGYAATLAQTNTEVRPTLRYPIASSYIEDTYKATPRLTLSAGLRYLWIPIPHTARNTETYFDPTLFKSDEAPIVNNNGTITPTPNYNPLNGLVFNGVNGTPLNFSNVHENYLGPTVGFALDPFGDGLTSVRGGYGITYLRVPTGSDCSLTCANNPPFVQEVSLVTPRFPFAVGAEQKPQGAPGLSTQLKDIQASQIQTYSLSVQHQFPGAWVASVAGVGNIMRHGATTMNINQPMPESSFDFNPAINTGKVFTYLYGPYLGYGAINAKSSNGVTYWNGLELALQHSISQALFLQASYTWQHGLSNVPGGNFFTGGSTFQDIYNPSRNYGNTTINTPQVFTASLIWSLPWFRHGLGLTRQVLGGWQFSNITTAQSGFSLNPGLSSPTAGLAKFPDATSQISGPKHISQWFNTAAFTQPAAGYFGNAAAGSIRGPGLVDFDMALYKTFHLSERNTIQFRAEFFNIFNHTNFNTVGTTLGAATFGEVTNAADPRIGEFALHYAF